MLVKILSKVIFNPSIRVQIPKYKITNDVCVCVYGVFVCENREKNELVRCRNERE